MILALTSDTLTAGQIYDSASTILQQKLLQVQGIGDVTIGGSSLPAVRVELNPRALFQYGIGLEDVRAALSAANANSPKGGVRLQRPALSDLRQRHRHARRGVPIADRRLSQQRRRAAAGRRHGQRRRSRTFAISASPTASPRCCWCCTASPGANVIDVVDRIRALIPELQASIPASIRIIQTNDRTETIRASLRDVERTLLIAIALVVLVVFIDAAQRARRAGTERGGAAVADRHLRRDVSARLQSRQPVADGAHGRHRLRGRRCHRRAGEHLAPRRARHAARCRPRC